MTSCRRLSPSLVVAATVLALASGGVGYAAGQVTSAQIKDGTIQSRDVANGSLTGQDVRDGTLSGLDLRPHSIARGRLDPACGAGEVEVFGGCVPRRATGPGSQQAAVDDCNRRGGRLPSIGELRWIAAHDEFFWADGNPNNYEFSSDWTTTHPYTPIGVDQSGFGISNASGQFFWHHCVIS